MGGGAGQGVTRGGRVLFLITSRLQRAFATKLSWSVKTERIFPYRRMFGNVFVCQGESVNDLGCNSVDLLRAESAPNCCSWIFFYVVDRCSCSQRRRRRRRRSRVRLSWFGRAESDLCSRSVVTDSLVSCPRLDRFPGGNRGKLSPFTCTRANFPTVRRNPHVAELRPGLETITKILLTQINVFPTISCDGLILFSFVSL